MACSQNEVEDPTTSDLVYTTARSVTTDYSKKQIDKYLNDPKNTVQIIQRKLKAKITPRTVKTVPKPNISGAIQKRKAKLAGTASPAKTQKLANGPKFKLNMENEESRNILNQISEITQLKEELEKLREENRQLKEHRTNTIQSQAIPTRNRFSQLADSADDNLDAMGEDEQSLTPGSKSKDEDWVKVLRNKNQRQTTPKGARREKRTLTPVTNYEEKNPSARTSLTTKKIKAPPISIYTGAPIVGIARWSVPRIGQGHLEVKW